MTCAEAREALGVHVVGALDPDEHAAVEAHLAGCAECTAEHARIALLPALLAHADGRDITPPPAGSEERLLDRVALEARRRRPDGGGRRRRARPVLAGLVAGAALGAGVTALALPRDAAPEPEAREAAGGYELVLRGAEGAAGRASFTSGRGGTELHLWVRGLPAGGEAVYEVKCERSGWSASAGTFRADARGRAYVVLTTAARLGEYERIRVVRRAKARETDVMTARLD